MNRYIREYRTQQHESTYVLAPGRGACRIRAQVLAGEGIRAGQGYWLIGLENRYRTLRVSAPKRPTSPRSSPGRSEFAASVELSAPNITQGNGAQSGRPWDNEMSSDVLSDNRNQVRSLCHSLVWATWRPPRAEAIA